MTTSNTQINARGARFPSYQGCFSKDKLPSPMRSGQYVINLEDSEGPQGGTHWVLLDYQPRSRSEYFDSFGAPPPMAVRQHTTGPLHYSNAIVQDLKSDACGQFCFKVLRDMAGGRKLFTGPHPILKDFSADRAANDKIARAAWSS